MKTRKKNTAIAPPTRRRRRYHPDADWTSAVGEVAVVAMPDDLPDWLIGAN